MKKENSNLEFRKIKSLKFLYEINSNGTILRNAKSKKHMYTEIFKHRRSKRRVSYIRIKLDKGYVRKKVSIARLVAECWLGPIPENAEILHKDKNTLNDDYRNLKYVLKYSCVSIPVRLTNCKTGEKLIFASMSKASRYLDKVLNNTFSNYTRILHRMNERRKHIYGFNIEYLKKYSIPLNAETVHNGSTEQETVHN